MVYVFGKAITNETLNRMEEYYGKTTTLKERAGVAMMMKNSEDKDVQVRQQVEKLMEKTGGREATICLIYNATGDTLTLVTYHDWSGQIGFTPYPPKIENGQWGVFLHVRNAATSDASSVGAVVYRGRNVAGEIRDWMQAWKNKKPNKAYSEIREIDHWSKDDGNRTWGLVYDKLNKSSIMNNEINEGGSSIVVIGNDPCSIFEAILMHPGADSLVSCSVL
ncbi:hypothetical protein CRYUN_Cryun02cG0171800 [Craigia yunnanensis]